LRKLLVTFRSPEKSLVVRGETRRSVQLEEGDFMSCKGLYIHVPFCERKCPYCDFYSVKADQTLMDAYTARVIHMLKTQPFGVRELETVYFGGGTPSALGGKRLARMMEAVFSAFTVAPDAEITVECNPHSALAPELVLMRRAGISRLSIGMQSVSDRQLRLLGRPHTASDVAQAAQAARRAGFEHLSFDLMLATPGQTLADIDEAVRFASELGAEHLSAYLLKVEDGTPFAARHIELECPDGDGQADYYRHAVETLAAHGYEQYEISNFARDGRTARHNLKYWRCEEYLGVGPSAHSFVNGRRFYFPRDLTGFLAAENPFGLLVDDGPGGDAEEFLMLRLRLADGVRFSTLSKHYPDYDLTALCERARRIPSRFLTRDEAGIRLTPEGFLLSNTIIGELLT